MKLLPLLNVKYKYMVMIINELKSFVRSFLNIPSNTPISVRLVERLAYKINYWFGAKVMYKRLTGGVN